MPNLRESRASVKMVGYKDDVLNGVQAFERHRSMESDLGICTSWGVVTTIDDGTVGQRESI
jgi:hypothetical protein